MKKYVLYSLVIFFIVSFSSCQKEKAPKKQFVFGEEKDIENNKYVTIEIDGAVWFAENLSCKLFRNGDTIMEARTDEEWEYALMNGIPAWCYPVNDSTLSEKYGLLYNFHAVRDSRGLAPEGCHISTKDEWQTLIDNYGGEWNAGFKLKSTTGWNNDGNGTNSLGFNALPGGYRISIGSFMDGVGEYGWWWTSTSVGYPAGNYAVLLPSINNLVNIVDQYDWSYGFSVRCVKN